MPQFTLTISNDGPVVTALIGCSAARVSALQRLSQPVPPSIPVKALIDTGASGTCVDEKVLRKLGLSPTGRTQVTTMSTGKSVHHAYEYDVSIVISAVTGQIPLRVPNVAVLGSDSSAHPMDAVIGRDILGSCVLIYNGANGTFTLTY